MKHLALFITIPIALAAPWPQSPGAWHSCRGDAGGAFGTRVHGLSCSAAALVTENGLSADLHATRLGHLACARHPSGSLWRYQCASADGRLKLQFSTF